jgi:hypothetical protein
MQGRLTRPLSGLLRPAACSLFVVYCVWNVFWLAQWRIPPSLFWALTGLPCPTTGGTRSLLCLARGDWAGSLHWNLLTVPVVALLAVTLACAGRCLWTRRPVLLHPRFLLAWASLLAVAWACKLLGDASYW